MVSLGQRKLGGYTVGISGITAIAGPSFKQNDLGSFSLGGFNLGSGEEVSNNRVSTSATAIDDSASRIFFGEFVTISEEIGTESLGAFNLGSERTVSDSTASAIASVQDDSFSRVNEEDEVIMSNTFFSPVFEGTQNLVRSGDSVLLTSSEFVNDSDTSTRTGDIISRVASEFIIDGVVLGSDGDIVSSQRKILDNSFSRSSFTDNALLRTASILTDSFTSTLESDIALTIQTAIFINEFASSTDGDVYLSSTNALDNSFSRLFNGDITNIQTDTFGNTFTKKIEDEEIVMSNTFFAPVFDGTQNLVRAGDPISADTIEQSSTISLTVGDVVARESNVEFNEANVLASAGDVLERVTERLFQESSKTTISGNALTRVLEQAFDDTFIAASDGDTTVLVELNILDSSFSRTFAEDVVIISNKLSENSLGQFQIGQEEEVLSTNRVLSETVIENNSVSQGVAGNTVAVTIDEFVEEVTRVLDGEIFELESSLFADTFTRTFEEDETIMSNTFFAPVFDGTQNLVRSGDTTHSAAIDLDPTIGLTTGDSVLANTDSLFNESDILSLAGDTVLGQFAVIEPEYLFTVNPGVFVRELGVDDTSNIGQMILGNNKLGAGTILDGKINRVDPFTARNLSLDRIDITSSISGAGTARQIVNDLIIERLSNIVILESIARKFDGEIATIDSSQFVNELARTFDGSIPLALSEQIEAFRQITEWALGQRQLGTTIEETREWSSLELVYQYEKIQAQENDPEFFTVEEVTNDLKARSEKVSVRELIDGGFTAVDLSGEGNTFNIRAPFDRDDVRPVDEWFVNSVDVENISRDTNTFEVELELVPEKSKEFDNEYGTFESPEIQSPSASQWTFEFEFGTIATRRVTVETTESSSGTLDVQELQLVLQPEQVRIFEENVSHLNLVYERSVPDGFDIVDDTSSDERNTVQISPPANVDESVVEGEYSFVSWETEWRAGTFVCTWEVATDEN